jgi:hypothetical protein
VHASKTYTNTARDGVDIPSHGRTTATPGVEATLLFIWQHRLTHHDVWFKCATEEETGKGKASAVGTAAAVAQSLQGLGYGMGGPGFEFRQD